MKVYGYCVGCRTEKFVRLKRTKLGRTPRGPILQGLCDDCREANERAAQPKEDA